MAVLIDGKKISAEYKAQLRNEISQMEKKPGLAVIIAGEDPASQIYVRNKKIACEEVGMYSEIIELPDSITRAELLCKIAELNGRDDINGILVQSPLPKGLDEKAVIAAISPEKDVDAFSYENIGRIMVGDYAFLPCTPAGIMVLLEKSGISVEGKECVVVGRSNIVGKPMALLLMHAHGTVTVCHSKTKNLAEVCRRADILVVAIGRSEFITGDMIKPGAVVIDVGMNRKPQSKKIKGDVEFASAEAVAGYITPVPGGVGPMTIAMLLKNTLTSAKLGLRETK